MLRLSICRPIARIGSYRAARCRIGRSPTRNRWSGEVASATSATAAGAATDALIETRSATPTVIRHASAIIAPSPMVKLRWLALAIRKQSRRWYQHPPSCVRQAFHLGLTSGVPSWFKRSRVCAPIATRFSSDRRRERAPRGARRASPAWF
jgi:hypothetical protein